MNFIVYDLAFLVLFTIAVFIFIKTRTHNLTKEGWMYLYRTSLGIKAIDYTAKKFKTILKPLQYPIIALGYTLMIGMIWMLTYTVYIYLRYPEITQQIKAPPIIPLIPYFPQLFGLQSFFPPFYFIYFILALIVVAVVHEFSHGIFARLNNIKIHSTGFAFLGPILGAFVEQDEKDMKKASKFAQLSVLAAGVFANILFTLIFLGLIWALFATTFIPAGINFTNYAAEVITPQDIELIDELQLPEFADEQYTSETRYVTINGNNKTYFGNPMSIQRALAADTQYLLVYLDAPAFNAELDGAIKQIDNTKISSFEELSNALDQYQPGDTVTIITDHNKETEYQITLSENENGEAFLGISITPPQAKPIGKYLYNVLPHIDNVITGTHYESTMGDSGEFIYYLFWWILVINFFVALFNMLPLGILDGGRFFLITIEGITGSEKAAYLAFKLITWFILAIVALMMLRWITAVF